MQHVILHHLAFSFQQNLNQLVHSFSYILCFVKDVFLFQFSIYEIT